MEVIASEETGERKNIDGVSHALGYPRQGIEKNGTKRPHWTVTQSMQNSSVKWTYRVGYTIWYTGKLEKDRRVLTLSLPARQRPWSPQKWCPRDHPAKERNIARWREKSNTCENNNKVCMHGWFQKEGSVVRISTQTVQNHFYAS